MDLLGVELGLLVAFLWGSGDILASLATRRLSTFQTTFLSQIASLIGLLFLGTVAFWLGKLSFTLPAFLHSAIVGFFTGCCAAIGYLAFYRALEVGPLALIGPLTATSPIFTLLLSV